MGMGSHEACDSGVYASRLSLIPHIDDRWGGQRRGAKMGPLSFIAFVTSEDT
jgi:hypothetical protein